MAGRGHAHVQMVTEEIKTLMDLEECMWNQRSKTDWLRHSDQNTKYFHYRAIERNKWNFISGLENDQGAWIEGEVQIGDTLVRYYSSLFSIANPIDFDTVLNGLEPRVSEVMNEELLKPFKESEVRFTLKQMDSETTPGLDGLPPLFYKQFWNKIGKEVSKAVLKALNSGAIPKNLNHTFLTLIPKIQSPKEVVDFRPIRLSNVLYKLIAKVLANRLKPLFPTLISETQSAFMSERLITDNVLIAHETLHYLK